MVKYLLIATLLFSSFSFGQITVTQYDIIGVSDMVEQAYDQSMSISHTTAGTDMNWNYAGLTEDSSGVLNIGAPGWADGSTNFPDATLSGDDNSGAGNLFLRKNTSALDILGFYGDPLQSGNDRAFHFAPQQRITPLPLTYNTTDQNSFVFEFTFDPGQQADSVKVKETTDQDFEADAWGEMTTPLGTFQVIRLKEVNITTDSTWVYTMGTPMLVDNGKDTTYSFSFWSNDQSAKFPLVEYEYNPNTQEIAGDITWLKAEPTNAVLEEEKTVFSLSPNPATNVLNISLNEELKEYTVIDITGSQVLRGRSNTVDVSHLKEGVYFVKVITNEKVLDTRKFVKK